MATFVAIKDFVGSKPSELSFRMGDLIRVTKRDEGQTMWIGSANGKVGSFPADCVEEKNTTSLRGSLISRGGGLFGGGNPSVPGTGPARHSSYTPSPDRPSEAPRARSNYTPSNTDEENENQAENPTSPSDSPVKTPPLKSTLKAPPAAKPPLSRSLSSQNTGVINRNNSPLRTTVQESPPSNSPIAMKASRTSTNPNVASSVIQPAAGVSSSPAAVTPLAKPPMSLALPKFSDVSLDENDVEVEPPPRSPPPQWKLSMLPPLPDRPDEEIKNEQPIADAQIAAPVVAPAAQAAPAAAPGPGKKTNEELRLDCINEIYQTEKDYVVDLDIIINVSLLYSKFNLDLILMLILFFLGFHFTTSSVECSS
jgi:hypothetical protein